MPMLAAVSTEQKIGVFLVFSLLVVWAVFLITHVVKAGPVPGSEMELAPNRKPYYDDEVLEGSRLERVLFMALILVVISAIGLPLYWLKEPNRQTNAKKGFNERSVHRGASLFLPADAPQHGAHFGCATCHGAAGQGGTTVFSIKDFLGATRQVSWTAPALNTVALRYTPDSIRTILVYGRANTPMPAWGVLGGGPMNDQQIDDLVNYLTTPVGSDGLAISADEAQAEATKAESDAKTKAQSNATSQEAQLYIKNGSFDEGFYLFDTYCGRCHTKGWSYNQRELPGGGAYGPNLTNGVTLRQFVNPEDHIDFVTNGAEYGKAYGARGIGSLAPIRPTGSQDPGVAKAGGGMPYFGKMLTEDQIKAIVEYERSLP